MEFMQYNETMRYRFLEVEMGIVELHFRIRQLNYIKNVRKTYTGPLGSSIVFWSTCTTLCTIGTSLFRYNRNLGNFCSISSVLYGLLTINERLKKDQENEDALKEGQIVLEEFKMQLNYVRETFDNINQIRLTSENERRENFDYSYQKVLMSLETLRQVQEGQTLLQSDIRFVNTFNIAAKLTQCGVGAYTTTVMKRFHDFLTVASTFLHQLENIKKRESSSFWAYLFGRFESEKKATVAKILKLLPKLKYEQSLMNFMSELGSVLALFTLLGDLSESYKVDSIDICLKSAMNEMENICLGLESFLSEIQENHLFILLHFNYSGVYFHYEVLYRIHRFI